MRFVTSLGCIRTLAWLAGFLAVAQLPIWRTSRPHAGMVTTAKRSSSTSAAPGGQPRPVYRHSVVPGGVYSASELKAALERDPVAARHYADFDRSHTRAAALPAGRDAYVSYRVGNAVYWTQRPVSLPAGEVALTDGTNLARARCGNRISFERMSPTSAEEPAPNALDEVVPQAEPARAQARYDGADGGRKAPYAAVTLPSRLVPEVFPAFTAADAANVAMAAFGHTRAMGSGMGAIGAGSAAGIAGGLAPFDLASRAQGLGPRGSTALTIEIPAPSIMAGIPIAQIEVADWAFSDSGAPEAGATGSVQLTKSIPRIQIPSGSSATRSSGAPSGTGEPQVVPVPNPSNPGQNSRESTGSDPKSPSTPRGGSPVGQILFSYVPPPAVPSDSSPVPEPSTFALVCAAAGFAWCARLRRK